jgi:hypothetical protein
MGIYPDICVGWCSRKRPSTCSVGKNRPGNRGLSITRPSEVYAGLVPGVSVREGFDWSEISTCPPFEASKFTTPSSLVQSRVFVVDTLAKPLLGYCRKSSLIYQQEHHNNPTPSRACCRSTLTLERWQLSTRPRQSTWYLDYFPAVNPTSYWWPQK